MSATLHLCVNNRKIFNNPELVSNFREKNYVIVLSLK